MSSKIRPTIARLACLEEFFHQKLLHVKNSAEQPDDQAAATNDDGMQASMTSITAMFTVARELLEDGKFAESELVADEVLTHMRHVYGARSPRLATVLLNLAACCAVSDPPRYRDAHQHIDAATAHLIDTLGEGNFVMSIGGGPLTLKMQVFELQRQYGSALAVAQHVLRLRAETYGPHHHLTKDMAADVDRISELAVSCWCVAQL